MTEQPRQWTLSRPRWADLLDDPHIIGPLLRVGQVVTVQEVVQSNEIESNKSNDQPEPIWEDLVEVKQGDSAHYANLAPLHDGLLSLPPGKYLVSITRAEEEAEDG